MARFIVADLTDPSSISKELEAIIPDLADPVQPLLEGASRPYAMFRGYWKNDWVLPVYRYDGLESKVIAPAEGKVKSLGGATAHHRGGTDEASIERQRFLCGGATPTRGKSRCPSPKFWPLTSGVLSFSFDLLIRISLPLKGARQSWTRTRSTSLGSAI
jgi:hypothetical protein